MPKSVVNVMIANGRFFGGGMQIAPDADPADGRFDVVAVGDRSRLATLALTRAVYAGTHLGRPRITTIRGTSVEARPARPGDVILIDMDGELRPSTAADIGADQVGDSDGDGLQDLWEIAEAGNLTTLSGGI